MESGKVECMTALAEEGLMGSSGGLPRHPRAGRSPAQERGIMKAGMMDKVEGTGEDWTILAGGNVLAETADRYAAGMDLWLRNGKIGRIVPPDPAEYPDEATIVDISGKFVIPGLVDLHTHVLGFPGELDLYVRSGVTCIRDVGSLPQNTVPLRDAISSGELQGPRIFTHGYLLDGTPEAFPGMAFSRGLADTDDCRATIEEELELGVDGIKLLFRLKPDLVEYCLRTAKSLNLPTAGHFGEVTLDSYAVGLGIDSIEHIPPLAKDLIPEEKHAIVDENGHLLGPFRAWAEEIVFDAPEAQRLIRLFRDSGTLLVATLTTYEVLLSQSKYVAHDPSVDQVPDEMRAMWQGYDYSELRQTDVSDVAWRGFENCQRFAAFFFEEVGRIGIGTDAPNLRTPPGIALHRELVLLASAGIAESDLLRSATLDACRFLGCDRDRGSIENGKVADLIVLDKDPLQDIAHTQAIHRIFRKGQAVEPIQIS